MGVTTLFIQADLSKMSTPSNIIDEDEHFTAGSVCQGGLLESNNSLGFTEPQAVTEIDGNSRDAFNRLNMSCPIEYQPKILWDIKQDKTFITDNAAGMTKETIKDKMLAYYRQNNSDIEGSGRSGMGGKIALQILSKETQAEAFTRVPGGKLLYFKMPFCEMLKEGKIDDMVCGRIATPDEKHKLYKYYEEKGLLDADREMHGTQFIIPTSDELRETLISNYEEPYKSTLNPLYREGVVFGSESIEFKYIDYESGEHTLNMYDYFSGEKKDYYLGPDENTIEVWQDIKKKIFRFIVKNDNGEYIEFPKLGGGYSKVAVEGVVITSGLKKIGDICHKVGVRRDPQIFNEDIPELIKSGTIETDYNVEHIGYMGIKNANTAGVTHNKYNEKFLQSTRLRRNGQIIGLCPTYRNNSNARADPAANYRYNLMQSELCFNTLSKQKNPLDFIFGTQLNKNQHNPESIPPNLVRLIDYLIDRKVNKDWNWMEEKVTEKNPPPPIKVADIKKAKTLKKVIVAETSKVEEDTSAEEVKKTEEAKKAEEAKRVEEAKKAEEAKRVEEAKKAEEAKRVEEAKKAEEAKRVEEAKKAEEANRVEETKKAEEAKKSKKTEPKPQTSPTLVEEHFRGPIKGRDILNIINSNIDPDEDYNGIPVEVYNLMFKYQKYKNN